MAFLPVGLKKQLNKANQHLAERLSGAERTQLDNEYSQMEQRTDVFHYMLSELQYKTRECLQPNPSVRSKMMSVKSLSVLSGEAKVSTYPQPEGMLASTMALYGRKMQEFDHKSILAETLIEVGEGLAQMADLRYALDDEVKQNFLEPLEQMQSKEVKEVLHHRKKLKGRKLDFDYKRRVGCPQLEMQNAEKKFAESLELAQVGMHNLIDASDSEHVAELDYLVQALHTFHKGCVAILDELTGLTAKKLDEVREQPEKEFVPKTLQELLARNATDNPDAANTYTTSLGNNNGNNNRNTSDKMAVGKAGQLQSLGTSVSNVVESHSVIFGERKSNDVFNAWEGVDNSSLINTRTASAPNSLEKSDSGWSADFGMLATSSSSSTSTGRCKALFDFVGEHDGELSFKEGDDIVLSNQIDDNWFEGRLNGKTGLLPISYVQVIVPLPH